MSRVHRFDWVGPIVVCKGDEAPPPGAIAARETPEGYLRVEGRINGCGVYQYENEAGETWGELRTPEYVGAPAFLESWQLRPVTDDHPPVWLDATNVDQYRRGTLGTNRFDGEHTIADMLIESPELIAKIRAGKTQLSGGYTCVLIAQKGEFNGIPYDFIQTEGYANHAAVVDFARGGPTCSLVFDGAARRRPTPDHRGASMPHNDKQKKDAQLVTSEGAVEIPPDKLAAVMALLAGQAEPQEPPEPPESPMGDEDPEAPEPAAQAAPKGDAAMRAKIDMLEAENKRLKDDFGVNVSARTSLVTNAAEILGSTNIDSMSDAAIKKAVIVAVTPDMAKKLKGNVSADYVDAAYEMALKSHAKTTDSSGELLGLTGRVSANNDDKSLNDAYQQMLDDRRDGVEQKVA